MEALGARMSCEMKCRAWSRWACAWRIALQSTNVTSQPGLALSKGLHSSKNGGLARRGLRCGWAVGGAAVPACTRGAALWCRAGLAAVCPATGPPMLAGRGWRRTGALLHWPAQWRRWHRTPMWLKAVTAGWHGQTGAVRAVGGWPVPLRRCAGPENHQALPPGPPALLRCVVAALFPAVKSVPPGATCASSTAGRPAPARPVLPQGLAARPQNVVLPWPATVWPVAEQRSIAAQRWGPATTGPARPERRAGR